MRLGFLGVTLCLVSVVAAACGGNVLSPDEDGAVSQAFCGEMVEGMRAYSQCSSQSPDESFYAYLDNRCERLAHKHPSCMDDFATLTRCQADALTRCAPEREECDAEEQAYLFCVSGGTCASLGGSSFSPASESAPVESFNANETCECLPEIREPGSPPGEPPGGACESWEDCGFICCPCASGEYTATVCDKSATGGVGLGRCASVEETCAATAAECERMQARNTSL